MNKVEIKEEKPVRASVIFENGEIREMEFADWKAYTDYVEAHHGEITEARGVV